MATAADVIRGALRTLGVLASSETPSAAQQSDGLEVLNGLLDSWAGERLALFASLRSTHALTPSLSPHTIGASGTFNVTRPVRVTRASLVASGSPGGEQPISLLTDAQWQATQGKTTTGTPSALWVESSYPLMKLWLWPVPSAADTLVLYSWQQLAQFPDASTTFDFPPGYGRALRTNLAVELAPEYGVSPSNELLGQAAESKANVKRLNMQPSIMRPDPTVSGGPFNLVSGDA